MGPATLLSVVGISIAKATITQLVIACPTCAAGATECHHEAVDQDVPDTLLPWGMAWLGRLQGDCIAPVVLPGDELIWSPGPIVQGDIVITVFQNSPLRSAKIWAGQVETPIFGGKFTHDVFAATEPETIMRAHVPFRLRVRHLLRDGEMIDLDPERTRREVLAPILARRGPIDFVAETALQKLPVDAEAILAEAGGVPEDQRSAMGLAAGTIDQDVLAIAG